MNKGLEALERIKNIELSHFGYDSDENLDGEWEYTPVDVSDGTIEENYKEEIDIIETELKEKDELEEMFNNDEELIKKLDKKVMLQDEILRIIKEKDVKVWEIKSCNTFEEYNDSFEEDLIPHSCLEKRLLNQAEFDLLKGWLN